MASLFYPNYTCNILLISTSEYYVNVQYNKYFLDLTKSSPVTYTYIDLDVE